MSPVKLLAIPPEFASVQPFTLKIAVEQTLVVYLNDRVLTHYAHCLPSAQINAVHIVYPPENLQVQSVQVLEQTNIAVAVPQRDRTGLSSSPESPSCPSPVASHPIAQTIPPETTDIPPLLRDLPPQFEPLRSLLQANLAAYIKVSEKGIGHVNSGNYSDHPSYPDFDWGGDLLEPWQSKIGGHPYLPQGTGYPTDLETGEMMMFLMQVNCADLPIIDEFTLPQQGILQFYVGLDVPMCALSPEQHRILYFPEISQDKNNLITDFGFLAEFAAEKEWYDDIYALTFSAQQDLFFVTRDGYKMTFDVPEELKLLYQEFDQWLGEQDDQETINRRESKLGGEVESHSYVHETVGEAKGRLLLELNHPFNGEDYFYFFIEARDLVNLDFSKVESYFMRT